MPCSVGLIKLKGASMCENLYNCLKELKSRTVCVSYKNTYEHSIK